MLLSWAYPFCLIGYLCSVFFLVSVILMQEGKGGSGLGGLSAGEGVHVLLGTGAANVLKKTTSWGIGFFLLSCVLLSVWTTRLEPPPSPINASEALIGEDIPEDVNLKEDLLE